MYIATDALETLQQVQGGQINLLFRNLNVFQRSTEAQRYARASVRSFWGESKVTED